MKWWLSFADPETGANLGCAIIDVGEVRDSDVAMLYAVHRAHGLGLNPGGEVLGIPLQGEPPAGFDMTERFMTPEEAERQATVVPWS